MTPASGFRTAEAGWSGLPRRAVLAVSAGAEDGSAMRAAGAEQDGAVARSDGPGPDSPMTPASSFGTVEAGRSGLPLRAVPALSVGAEDGSAVRTAGPGDVAARGLPCESGEIEDARSGP